jgi:universal stress protein E
MVVVDPTTERQPAFERGLDSARDTGAPLQLYVCVDESSGYDSLDQARDSLQATMEALAARALEAGVDATTEIDYAANWRRGAVSAAARCSASMIFKSSFDHSQVHREKRETADWTLLRMAPCPVLMVKDFHDWKRRRILAAINPASTDNAHIKLNHQIVSVAREFADSYGSDAHFVVAYQDLNHAPDADRIAADCGANREHVHLKQGKPADVIRATAQAIDVDLVIVGTVARDGIKGRVVGNTCEKLLDRTHSDLLVLN